MQERSRHRPKSTTIGAVRPGRGALPLNFTLDEVGLKSQREKRACRKGSLPVLHYGIPLTRAEGLLRLAATCRRRPRRTGSASGEPAAYSSQYGSSRRGRN